MANSSVIGLDIGSNQIKAVHLERRRNQWALANAGIVPTPPESVQDGVILDIPRVTEAVRQLFRENRMPSTDTVAAVSGSHVLVRSIKVPDMSVTTLRRSIRFEAAKHVDQGTTGVSIEDSAVEFEITGKSGEPPQLDVLLVVAPQPMVSGRVSVMDGAGLEPVAVDVEAFALQRAMEAAGLLPPPGQAIVVMNMGATYTDLNIVVGGEVAVTRSIPIGGNALTSSVASVLNVPPEQAEEQKRLIDVAAGAASAADDGDMALTPASDPARQVTLPFVDELVRELRRSVIYFQSQAAEAGMAVSVDRLVLAGGGTQLRGLPQYLRDRLGMNVVLLDPFALQSGGPQAQRWQQRGPELAVALGLALKEYN
jgi:type IV pilus assembly protein PilM